MTDARGQAGCRKGASDCMPASPAGSRRAAGQPDPLRGRYRDMSTRIDDRSSTWVGE